MEFPFVVGTDFANVHAGDKHAFTDDSIIKTRNLLTQCALPIAGPSFLQPILPAQSPVLRCIWNSRLAVKQILSLSPEFWKVLGSLLNEECDLLFHQISWDNLISGSLGTAIDSLPEFLGIGWVP